MTKFLLITLLLSFSALTHAAKYCGTVTSNPVGDKQIVDGKFDVWVSSDLFTALSYQQRLLLLQEGNCVCVSGAIEAKTYPDPQSPACLDGSGPCEVVENSFTKIGKVTQSQGCHN